MGEEGKEHALVGIAKCSPKDKYCKNTGRKLALADAMSYLSLPKEARRAFGVAYDKETNGKLRSK